MHVTRLRGLLAATNQCEDRCMRKRTISMAFVFSGGTPANGSSMAQDPPATKSRSGPRRENGTCGEEFTNRSREARTGHNRKEARPGSARSEDSKGQSELRHRTEYRKRLTQGSADVDPNILIRGLKDALAGGKTLLTDDEAKAAMVAFQSDLRKKQEAKMEVVGDANKKEGDAFLAANKTKDGVVTLSSGLQYKILKEGTGPKPSATDSVVCNYKGTLLDNTEFDSSYKRGQPATFPVGQVIKGWTEVLQLMPVGSKWEVFVPSELGYGPRGAGGAIGPNAMLIFEIELLSIQGK